MPGFIKVYILHITTKAAVKMLEKTKGGCGRIEIDSTKIDVVSFVFEDMGENQNHTLRG